jgi:hypothetical protein
MTLTILLTFALKSVISAAVWSGELGEVCYRASLHVRALERRPFTPAEDQLQRFAMKRSARFVLGLPVIGSLGATIWPGIALPRGGNFEGAESFRSQVRHLCGRASLWDIPLALLCTLYVFYSVLTR